MTQLPPPSGPPTSTPPQDDAPPTSRRRWLVGASIGGAGLAIAGLVAGATAMASPSGEPTIVSTDAVPAVENDGQVPPGFDEFLDEAARFGECLTGQLDLPADLAEMDPGNGGVIVGDPSGDGTVTIIEFGDGDGSVTVDRSDGEITVQTDGDVDVTTGEEIIASLDDLFADAEAAFAACADQLPELPALDDLIGSLPGLEDFELDQLPSLDELEERLPGLDELFEDLEDLDLENLDEVLGDLFDQQN